MAKAKNPVQAVDRTFEILEVIQERNGATVTEIADRVEIGMSAIHNHLSTLAARGYVVSCPIHRVDDDWLFDSLADKVLGAANAIEIKRTYS